MCSTTENCRLLALHTYLATLSPPNRPPCTALEILCEAMATHENRGLTLLRHDNTALSLGGGSCNTFDMLKPHFIVAFAGRYNNGTMNSHLNCPQRRCMVIYRQ